MLKKLFIYEMNAVTPILLSLNVFVIIITALGRMMLALNVFNRGTPFSDTLGILSLTFYSICILAVYVATYILLFVRYHKSVFTDEGYLLHTLPVNKHGIIISKLSAASIWLFVNLVITSVSIYMLVSAVQDPYDIQLFWANFRNFLNIYLHMPVSVAIILCIFFSIMACVSNMLMVYAAIGLGQIFENHKILGSFIFYGIIYAIMQAVMTGILVMFNLLVPNPTLVVTEVIIYMRRIMITATISTILFSIAAYVIAWYMMEKKLNMD